MDEVVDSSSGVLVSPGNTKEICDAVIRLNNDSELRNNLGVTGRKLVEEKYTWDKLGRRLLDVCEFLDSRK